MYFIIVFAARL